MSRSSGVSKAERVRVTVLMLVSFLAPVLPSADRLSYAALR